MHRHVYLLSIVGKSISWKLAAGTYAAVAALGVLAGLVARLIA
jgi:hypothetical protein